MTEWDKIELARSYNKETKEYDKLIEDLLAVRPVGKGVVCYNDRMYEVDYNFNPPRVTEIEEKE